MGKGGTDIDDANLVKGVAVIGTDVHRTAGGAGGIGSSSADEQFGIVSAAITHRCDARYRWHFCK